MARPPETPNLPANEQITIKVHAPMKEWIKEQGGSKYIRQLVREDRNRKLSQ